jgi:uncharacterized ubiquitin-like protein YukD
MKEIKIRLLTMDGTDHEIETPLDLRVKDFIIEVAIALGLPMNDVEGDPISWRLDNKSTGKMLIRDQTLGENHVREGQTLILVRSTMAG